jgi:ABC-2 type transport system permease protein
MRNVWTITKRELYAYFGSFIAYGIIAAFLAVEGFLFYLFLYYAGLYGQPMAMSDMMGSGWFYFFLILYAAVLTMRLLADEQRSGTLELVLTAPVRDWELIVGKYLAALAVYAVTLFISLYQLIILKLVGDPEIGVTLSGYLGLFLGGAAMLALGTLASTFTSNQAIAAIVCIGFGLVLWLIEFARPLGEIVTQLAFFTHFQGFMDGLIDTQHIVYYLSLIAASLFLATQTLQARRWR